MNLLSYAIDSTSTSFIVINKEGIILDINKETERIFGFKKSELIHEHINIFLPDHLKDKHSIYLKDFFKKPNTKMIGNGRILTALNKNKEEIKIEVEISFFHKYNQIYGIASINNIGDEYKTKKLLEITQEVAKIGSWKFDLTTEKLSWSKITYIIHELEVGADLKIEDAINFYHEDDKPIIRECVKRGVSELEKWDVQLRIVTAKNNVKWVRALGFPVIEKGKVIGLEGTFQDVHQEKINEQNLEKISNSLKIANDELMQFSYRTSHDLKSPLLTMRCLAVLTVEDINAGDLDMAKQNLELIITQAKSLETLVTDLLNLAKADAIDDKPESIDFSKITDEVIMLNKTKAEINKVKIYCDINTNSEWCFPNVRILQILNNLISNSIKYYDENKEERFVKISIFEKDNNLSLSVIDNGQGIPFENEEEIFKMFKRFHIEKVSGSGLGMYVLKKHVDHLKGTINVKSSDEGTEINIIFEREEQ